MPLDRVPPLREDTLRVVDDMNLLYIRQLANRLQERALHDRMERELRVCEAARRLLAACTQPRQALDAARSLLVAQVGARSAMAELQRHAARRSCDKGRSSRSACSGRIAISDIRIPLMWKDKDHFKNNGGQRRYALFCLLRAGSQVCDSGLLLVDASATDLCFESTTVFSDVLPSFRLHLELYSCRVNAPSMLIPSPSGSQSSPSTTPIFPITPETPRPCRSPGSPGSLRLRERLGGSVGRAGGQKASVYVDEVWSGALSHIPSALMPVLCEPRFHLLAHTVLSLNDVQDGFRTHDLVITAAEGSPYWLPLYGRLCCRLVAQPSCLTRTRHSGFLKVKIDSNPNVRQSFQAIPLSNQLYCVLLGPCLLCYPREQQDGEPSLAISISKDTRLAVEQPDEVSPRAILLASTGGNAPVYRLSPGKDENSCSAWLEAFTQHIYDLASWGSSCNELMHIDAPSPALCRPCAFKSPMARYYATEVDGWSGMHYERDGQSKDGAAGCRRRATTLDPEIVYMASRKSHGRANPTPGCIKGWHELDSLCHHDSSLSTTSSSSGLSSGSEAGQGGSNQAHGVEPGPDPSPPSPDPHERGADGPDTNGLMLPENTCNRNATVSAVQEFCKQPIGIAIINDVGNVNMSDPKTPRFCGLQTTV
uniref:rhotekin-like isoform X2 n=1 Tax=Myxine glutinosa TaxID=7769 RepID=UPI00358DEAF4